MFKVKYKPPGVIRRARIKWLIGRLARREGAVWKPFLHQGSDGTISIVNAPYQLLTLDVLGSWIELLGSASALTFASLRTRLTKLFARLEDLEAELHNAEARVTDDLKFGGPSAATIVTLMLASMLGLATVWPFVLSLDWPLPLTALTALALATIELVLSAAVGAGAAALVLDVHETPFALTPRQRTLILAITWFLAILLLGYVVVLAWVRSEDGRPVLWLAIGLIVGGLGMHAGMALYEARFHLALSRVKREIRQTKAAIAETVHSHGFLIRWVMATARSLRDLSATVLHDADASFQRTWRRTHYQPTAIVPSIPAVTLPSDTDLYDKLVVPLELDRPEVDWHARDPDDGGPASPPSLAR